MSTKIDRKTGLSNVKFNIVSNIEVSIEGAPLHFVSVKVHCDRKVTPFCDKPA